MRNLASTLGLGAIIAALALPIVQVRSAHAKPPPMQTRKLANGLDVIVVENHALPLVTVEIAVKNGSMTVIGDPTRIDSTLFTSM